MKKKLRFTLKVLLLSLPFIVIDVITKLYAVLHKSDIFCIFNNSVCFNYSENTGIAFSIPIPILIITILNMLLLAVILKLAQTELKESKLTILATALIFGGGVGNLVDRFFRNFVVDFISVLKFPVFNFADICISLGVLIIILFYGKIKR